MSGKEAVPDLRRIPKDQAEKPQWQSAIDSRPRALIKCGDRLYEGCAPTAVPADDPHAAYEGRTSGSIQVLWADRGEVDAEFRLPAPPVWDGVAAANNCLYVSTTSGEVFCLGGK